MPRALSCRMMSPEIARRFEDGLLLLLTIVPVVAVLTPPGRHEAVAGVSLSRPPAGNERAD